MKKFEIDMTKGSIFKNTLSFAIPLIFSNVLQLLYNMADMIVVGRWAGANALASVGATQSLNGLLVSTFVSLSIGASVCVSKYYGGNNREKLENSVHSAVALSLVAGVIALIVGLVFSKSMLIGMDTPKGVVLDGAVLYMKILFIGVPGSLVYNFGAAILRAVGDSKRPFYILAISGMLNVILNMVFVIGFGMSVEGVAIATSISNYLSAILVTYCLVKSDTPYRLRIKKIRFHEDETLEILRIGIPSGIQGSIFSLSNMLIQSSVNSFGAATMAGNSAAGSVGDITYIAMHAFYDSTITAVSQNYGAKNEKKIYKYTLCACGCVTVVGLFLGLLTVLLKYPILGIYISDSSKAIEAGCERMMATLPWYFMCGLMDVLGGFIRGMGYSALPMASSLVGACGFRILWIFTFFQKHKTLSMLFLCWPISWGITIILHLTIFAIIKRHAINAMNAQ